MLQLLLEIFENVWLVYAKKTKRSLMSQKLGLCNFCKLVNSVLNKVKSTILPQFNSPEVLPSVSNKTKLLAEVFSKNSILMIQVSLYLNSLLELIWNCIILLYPLNCLKLVSAIVIEFLFFHQMIVLQKLWKMLFISSKKLFSFSRYSIFCISILASFFTCRPLLWRIIEDKS